MANVTKIFERALNGRVAFAYSTKDRVEMTNQTIWQAAGEVGAYDLIWIDGSVTDEGKELPHRLASDLRNLSEIHGEVYGGPDAAIVYALTEMLERGYDYCGLIENDQLLQDGWFEKTFALFEQGEKEDGLPVVGMVSPRAFADRALIGRDGYAVMHNTGAGVVLMTAMAARLVLQTYRTGFTHFNRRVFHHLSDIDIGAYWAFKGGHHAMTADWHFDAAVAHWGFASLAVVPNMATIVGLDIVECGLRYASSPITWANTKTFDRFVHQIYKVRSQGFNRQNASFAAVQHSPGTNLWTVFPHQISSCLKGAYSMRWKLAWSQGCGPFAYESTAAGATCTVPVYGPAQFTVSTGSQGGSVEICARGQSRAVRLDPDQMVDLPVSFATVDDNYRSVELRALEPGVRFHGISTREPQPWLPALIDFDHSKLPPVGT